MAPRNQGRPELREWTEPLDGSWRRWRRGAKSFRPLKRLPLNVRWNNQNRMPKVVSLADYLSDHCRSAKVRHNEAVAHALRMQELIEQSDRRLIASDRQLRRTSQSFRSSGSAKKDGTPSGSR